MGLTKIMGIICPMGSRLTGDVRNLINLFNSEIISTSLLLKVIPVAIHRRRDSPPILTDPVKRRCDDYVLFGFFFFFPPVQIIVLNIY